jgi:hypothetical protein
MDEETPDELPGVERHHLLPVLVAIVLPPEARPVLKNTCRAHSGARVYAQDVFAAHSSGLLLVTDDVQRKLALGFADKRFDCR